RVVQIKQILGQSSRRTAGRLPSTRSSPRSNDRSMPFPQKQERDGQRHDQRSEHGQFEDEVPEQVFRHIFQLPELRRHQQHTPDNRDEPNEKERLRNERVLAERDLDRIEQLDDEQDQENPAQQRGNTRRQGPIEDALDKADAPRDEKSQRTAGK